MLAFEQIDALVVPLNRPNIDTDALIPKQFLKSIRRTGFGANLFDGWRYLDVGVPGQDCAQRPRNPEFPLNQPRYAGAQILLAQENFGCGSSREHAVWALHEYGFRALIAPSFGEIFYTNCFKNGVLPVVLSSAAVANLFSLVENCPGYRLTVDLRQQRVTTPAGMEFPFAVDRGNRHRLLNGMDEIALTLQSAEQIRAYERNRRQQEPWLFPSAGE
ncbi:MAG TPA: 3-isopropylmalate dehydratase small subunit [Steroidobacteraceae bacterium]|nr:3-isopropylmalate dehydratase small subunit [Steroidobacteraceae bacterium]